MENNIINKLTSEDIEKEGWTDMIDIGMSHCYGSLLTKSFKRVGEYHFKLEMKFWYNSNRMRITHSNLSTIFEGHVETLEEFKVLMKLLNAE